MALGDSVLFGMMRDKMDWLGQRQVVLSQNVANADTPDYAARDLAPLSFKDTMRMEGQQVALAVAAPMHIGTPEGRSRFASEDAGSVYETSVNGNSVVLEEQMMKLSETASDFSLATSIYRKYIAMHRAALGRGQGG
jgi:flagellar basal-body rod protein FlgB